MRKNKVDCDVFYYKGQYLDEQPQDTRVYNRYYEEGVGLVAQLKHKTVYTEIICILLLVINILFLVFYPSLSTKLSIPSSANYYDGKLYVNIVADENNRQDTDIMMLNKTYTLSPGERLYIVDIDNPPSTIDVRVKTSLFMFNKIKDCTIQVHTVY